jgi:hypothetical protein
MAALTFAPARCVSVVPSRNQLRGRWASLFLAHLPPPRSQQWKWDSNINAEPFLHGGRPTAARVITAPAITTATPAFVACDICCW